MSHSPSFVVTFDPHSPSTKGLRRMSCAEAEALLAVADRPSGRTLRVGEAHDVGVEYVPGARYPFRPTCSCGQAFRGYVADHAAQLMADAHAAEARVVEATDSEGAL